MANYSWGEIRLLLRQYAAKQQTTYTFDEIDHAMNSAYSYILGLQDWAGIEQTGQLRTLSAYSAGSITLTPGSTLVTGTATAWTQALSGMQLFFGYPGNPYTVTITSPTTLQLDRPYDPYGGNTAPVTPNSGYWIAPLIYNLPDNCRALKIIRSPFTGLALDEMEPIDFATLEGIIPVGAPASNYIPQPDGLDSQTGSTVKRIMLWPVTQNGHSYPIEYDAVQDGFDGEDTASGPLDFVSPGVLVARAKFALTGDMAALAEFNEQLRSMTHIENGQRQVERMRPAQTYTRHRIERLMRKRSGNYYYGSGDYS